MEDFISGVENLRDSERILKEGNWAYHAYVLLSGKARVFKKIGREEVHIGDLKEGDIFGEMSFFGMAKRTASVVADGDVTVGTITRDTFMLAINELSEEARTTLEQMCQDLSYLNDIYTRLTSCLHEISSIGERAIDPKVLERETQHMPEFLGSVAALMNRRLNSSINGCVDLITHVEQAAKPILSLSTSLIRD